MYQPLKRSTPGTLVTSLSSRLPSPLASAHSTVRVVAASHFFPSPLRPRSFPLASL